MRVRTLLSRAVSEFFDDRCTTLAAAISYYGLVAVFPLIILAVGAFGLVAGHERAQADIIDFLMRNLPLRADAGRRDLRDLLESVTGGAAAFGVVGVVGLVLSASGLMGAVRNGVNAAWDAPSRRPPVQGKLLDVLLVLLAGLLAGGSLALTLVTSLLDIPGLSLAWAIPPVLSFAVFLGLYRVLPASRPRVRDVWPGALVGAAGYELAQHGFSLYLMTSGGDGAVYGSIGAVVAFLVFVFVASNVFLLGAEVASEWPRVRDSDVEALRDGGAPASEQVHQLLRRLVGRDDP